MTPFALAIFIVILLFSIIVHEVMHGLVALYFGDTTAQRSGRLTLNPIPHIDPIGSILLPALLLLSQSVIGGVGVVGWAKPVPVNPLNFRDLRKGELWTSAAGILANLGLAVLGSLLFHLSLNFAPYLLLVAFGALVRINLTLAVFNLLPIPPLDGSKIVMSLLPFDLAQKYSQIEKYSLFILLALVFIPQIGGVFIGLISLIVGVLLHVLGF